ncbi:MAG: AAA family ATPase, partial [bacterium]
SGAARDWLARQAWPGNVRELGHLLERVTLLVPDDSVGAETLAGLSLATPIAPPRASADGAPADDESAADAARIRGALQRAGGNVVRAAQLLGLGRNALRYRMRRLGLARDLPLSFDGDALPRSALPERDTAPPAPSAPVSPAWEQKPVAVLTLSLAFPAAPNPSDYEPWTAARRCERAIVERVEGFGGLMLPYSPSRLTAVFGVPRALEQAPLRAVQAALSITRAARPASEPAPEIRAAVHVGEVRFDAAAADPTAQLFPLGDTCALPERLLGHAGAGEVLLSSAAARRVERAFALSSRALQLGPAAADHVEAQAVQHLLRPEPTAGVAEGITQFVGRTRELDLLLEVFARAAGGQGHVVVLAGEAGIGKSRLLNEWRARLADQPHRWIEGRCASYGAATPFLPLIDALRQDAGIDDRDDEAAATAKLEANIVGLGADLAWTLPFIKLLLSLPIDDAAVRALDTASRRSELFRALRACLLRAAEQAPLVVVVEDLHWADPASIEWLAFLADVVPTTRALLVVSHRIGTRLPFAERSYCVHVGLPPLTGVDVATMTGALLGAASVPDPVHALVATKAEGNPFFVEELLRSLLEDGSLQRDGGRIALAGRVDERSVPSTVQEVLIARLDRLAEESRRAIQVASVIGREFALRLLTRISEAGEGVRSQVEDLRSLELIYEKALHPELAYMFKHALTHDVAYESVVAERRRSLHGTIGRAIEMLYADRLAEHVETLAHHFGRAEDWTRALQYHEQSVDKAADAHANRAVVERRRAALAIVDRLGAPLEPGRRARLEERLALAHFYLSEYGESGPAYEAAAAHAADDAARALYLGAAGYSHFWAHQYADAQRCNVAALALAQRGALPAGEAFAMAAGGFFDAVQRGDLDSYAAGSQAALVICRRHPNAFVEAFASWQMLQIGEWTGDYAAAMAHAEHSLALSRALRRPELLILCNWFLGKTRCCSGDLGGALTLLGDAYQLCDRIGDRAWKSRLLNTLGWCYAEIGDVARAREHNEAAAHLARDLGDPEILANADINLALNHFAQGDLARAAALIEPFEATLEGGGDPWMRWRYSLHVHDMRARLELAHGAPDAALVALDAELAGARRHGAVKLEARALLHRGAALLELDRRDDAAASLHEALGVAERIGYLRG